MIIGIDLGTTNSLVAYYSDEGPKVIPNPLGKHLTPSVISIDEDNQIYVGEIAKERMLLYPERTVANFKRDMGTGKIYHIGDKDFRPEELSSFILRALKEDAERYLGEPVTEAVISVPAYFDDKRRKATKRAGELAGLRVERIISEPTAAAIAYGLYDKSQNTKFLVFDLGGGTFDVSILEMYHNILEVRAVAGDNYLGGEDFTQVIEKLFLQDHQLDANELDQKTILAIHQQAEFCKIAIPERKSFSMTAKVKDEMLTTIISYEAFERACEPLLDKIRKLVQRSFADAHIKLTDIDEVVLVGGATKLQIVRDFIVKLFKKFPNTSINPDETIVVGAAIQAAMKERHQAVKEVILTDVCSFTLGTEVMIERANGTMEDGHFAPIIERNTVIPASRTERFYTVRDNQDKITINVLQGESRFANNNLLLGELTIKVPKGPKGKEAVDVTYTYDINSILEVEVTVISTGEKQKKIIKGKDNEMTDAEIAERMKALAYLKIHPKDFEENKLLLTRSEHLYEESVGDRRLIIDRAIRQFEDALNTRDTGKIARAKEELQETIQLLEEEL